jgi:signal peptidase II
MKLARRTINYLLFATLMVLSVSCDQGTKLWARHSLAGRPGVSVIDGFWDFHFTENSGGAFSLFEGLPAGRFILTGAGVVILALLVGYLRKRAGGRWLPVAALGMIAGGAIGNLYDRIAYGRVTDFVHWHWRAHEWPVFNAADALLLVGGLLAVSSVERVRADAA